MAVAKKVGASTGPKGKVASMRPDEMSGGGLATNFWGTITNCRLVPWDYDGHRDEHILASRVTILADEGQENAEGEIVQHYSAGDLTNFVPSMDGENPVDLGGNDLAEMEGVFAYQVGSKPSLSPGSNWGHFLSSLVTAGYPLEEMDPDVRFVEGIYGYFQRMPQKARSGIASTSNKKYAPEILLITEYKEKRDLSKPTKAAKGATKSAPAAKSAAPAAATSANGSDDLSTTLIEALTNAAREKDGTLQKSDLAKVAIKSLTGGDKSKGVKLAGQTDFLEGLSEHNLIWDAEEGTLTLVE